MTYYDIAHCKITVHFQDHMILRTISRKLVCRVGRLNHPAALADRLNAGAAEHAKGSAVVGAAASCSFQAAGCFAYVLPVYISPKRRGSSPAWPIQVSPSSQKRAAACSSLSLLQHAELSATTVGSVQVAGCQLHLHWRWHWHRGQPSRCSPGNSETAHSLLPSSCPGSCQSRRPASLQGPLPSRKPQGGFCKAAS